MTYWLTIYFSRLFLWIFTRFQVNGKNHVPSSGAFLLVSNHISHFDPPIFSAASPRAIDWIGSDILFRNPIANRYFRWCHVIKVRQYTTDQTALREAVRRAKDRRCVGLFPEGGIRAGKHSVLGEAHKIYDGAFIIAALAGVPILPCLVIGSDRLYNPSSLLRRPPIWVRIGKPIEVQGKGRDEVERLKNETIRSIRDLAETLKQEGKLKDEDWPQTPQQRNSKIPPPKNLRTEG